MKQLPAIVITLLLVGSAHADSIVEGSVEAGQASATVCTACHGPQGNSVNPMWPNLAGQNASYLVAQINAFKEGLRSDPLMTPQAALLSDEDIANLAVYFESLPAAAQPVADANPSKIDRAEALFRGGSVDKGVPSCLACHGPTDRGNAAAAYPSLNGQHSVYIAKQLRDYAGGARESVEATNAMADIAERLDNDDIEALASYVQGLR